MTIKKGLFEIFLINIAEIIPLNKNKPPKTKNKPNTIVDKTIPFLFIFFSKKMLLNPK